MLKSWEVCQELFAVKPIYSLLKKFDTEITLQGENDANTLTVNLEIYIYVLDRQI